MDQISQRLDRIIALLEKQTEPVREVLTVSQVAEYLGQSEYTIREWVRMRKIPHFKVNGTIKFRKSRLDQWINRGEVPVLK